MRHRCLHLVVYLHLKCASCEHLGFKGGSLILWFLMLVYHCMLIKGIKNDCFQKCNKFWSEFQMNALMICVAACWYQSNQRSSVNPYGCMQMSIPRFFSFVWFLLNPYFRLNVPTFLFVMKPLWCKIFTWITPCDFKLILQLFNNTFAHILLILKCWFIMNIFSIDLI